MVTRHQKFIALYLIAAVFTAYVVGASVSTVTGIVVGLAMIAAPLGLVMAVGAWLIFVKPNPELIERAFEVRAAQKKQKETKTTDE